ncbi:MAG: ATP-binding cassette domain-containing protein [Anaerolineae bacterium]
MPHMVTRLGIARTYQNIRLFGEMTALENLLVSQHALGKATVVGALAFTPGYRREERFLRDNAMLLLDRFGLAPVADVQARTLPYGDQRRLELARALATKPKLLLLDEPTAGMNPVETHDLGAQIIRLREEGLTVLVIEHDMSLIQQVCDEIDVLNLKADRRARHARRNQAESPGDRGVSGRGRGRNAWHRRSVIRCWKSTICTRATARSGRCAGCRSRSSRGKSSV